MSKKRSDFTLQGWFYGYQPLREEGVSSFEMPEYFNRPLRSVTFQKKRVLKINVVETKNTVHLKPLTLFALIFPPDNIFCMPLCF
jgi:hypothetical protein